MSALANAVRSVPHAVGGVPGWQVEVFLPHEHHRRTCKAIVELIKAGALAPAAKELAANAFANLPTGALFSAVHDRRQSCLIE